MSNSRRFDAVSFESHPSPYPFRDQESKSRFLRLVRDHLGKDGEVTFADGFAHVAGQAMSHGLTNLAQSCNLSPVDHWPTIIEQHFAKSKPERVAASAAKLLEGGFEQNVASLVVRIYPADYFTGPLAGHFVERVDLQETLTVLAVDNGTSVLPVPCIVAASWGVPHSALFGHALDNLARVSKAQWSTLSIPPTREFGFDLLHGDFHAHTHILRRDPGLPRVGKEGNLIGIPACGVLFSYPIDFALDALTLESLLAISLGKCHDGPNAVSPHLYWRTPGCKLHLQRGRRAGKHTRFMPSTEFIECMVRLQKARSN